MLKYRESSLVRLGFVGLVLMALIAACFVVLIAQSDPVWGDVIAGFAPSREIVSTSSIVHGSRSSPMTGNSGGRVGAFEM